jgi:hypothetical protein
MAADEVLEERTRCILSMDRIYPRNTHRETEKGDNRNSRLDDLTKTGTP